jgi:hypothetical protein
VFLPEVQISRSVVIHVPTARLIGCKRFGDRATQKLECNILAVKVTEKLKMRRALFHLAIKVCTDSDVGLREIERLSSSLRSELIRFEDVRSAEPIQGEKLSDRVNATESVDVAAIFATPTTLGGVPNALVRVLKDWPRRVDRRQLAPQSGSDKLEWRACSRMNGRRQCFLSGKTRRLIRG